MGINFFCSESYNIPVHIWKNLKNNFSQNILPISTDERIENNKNRIELQLPKYYQTYFLIYSVQKSKKSSSQQLHACKINVAISSIFKSTPEIPLLFEFFIFSRKKAATVARQRETEQFRARFYPQTTHIEKISLAGTYCIARKMTGLGALFWPF